MVADFVRPFRRSFHLPTSLVLGTMAAPIGTDVSHIDLEDILNSILVTDFEPLAGFAEPQIPTSDFEGLAADRIESERQLVFDLDKGVDLGSDGFDFQTIDPRLLDTGTAKASIFQLDDEPYRLPSRATDRLVGQQQTQYRAEKLTEADVFAANQNAPDPQSHVQMPEHLDYFAPDAALSYTYERETHARDWTLPAFSSDPEPPGLVVSSIGLADELAGGCPIGPQPPLPSPDGSNADASSDLLRCSEFLDITSSGSLPLQAIPSRQLCAECTFAKKTAKVGGPTSWLSL